MGRVPEAGRCVLPAQLIRDTAGREKPNPLTDGNEWEQFQKKHRQRFDERMAEEK